MCLVGGYIQQSNNIVVSNTSTVWVLPIPFSGSGIPFRLAATHRGSSSGNVRVCGVSESGSSTSQVTLWSSSGSSTYMIFAYSI